MIIKNPIEVHDAIMVRLFTYDHNTLTRLLSPLAMEWAKKRGIQYTIQDDKAILFLLPSHMEGYTKWSELSIQGDTTMVVFRNSLDMIRWAGWATVKRRARFTLTEWRWLSANAPEQFSWMRE